MSHRKRSGARGRWQRRLGTAGSAVLILATAIGLVAWVFSPVSLPAKTPGSSGKAIARKAQDGAPPARAANPAAQIETQVAPPATPPAPPASDSPAVESPAAPGEEPDQAAPPRPRALTGRVLDPSGKPIARASIVAGGVEHFSDARGAFSVDAPPRGSRLLVKAPGFHRAFPEPGAEPLEVTLKPHAVKAAYLTYFGVGDKTIRGRVLELVDRTELNAVVIDVKGDRGLIPYVTEVPLAREAGAQGPVSLKDVEGMLAELKARGIYTIARVVVFKDNVLAEHRRDLAIIDTRTGRPWVDREEPAWVDPVRPEVWAYSIAITRQAVRKGFDEVQFDYVRFPPDGRLSAARYARENTRETRLPAIAGFLERARRALGPTGAFVAADVFGYTAFNENDTDIGQRVEELAPHLDYLCPMVYPSGYHVGIPGTRNPVANPYRVVYESVRLTRQRSAATNLRVRPWLQDFRDYAFDKRIFGPSEVRAQIKGAQDAGAAGWMLWNPRNDYTGRALAPEGSVAAR